MHTFFPPKSISSLITYFIFVPANTVSKSIPCLTTNFVLPSIVDAENNETITSSIQMEMSFFITVLSVIKRKKVAIVDEKLVKDFYIYRVRSTYFT